MKKIVSAAACLILLGCTTAAKNSFNTSTDSVEPGTTVSAKTEKIELYNGGFKVGDKLTDVAKGVSLPIDGKVSIISFVPSIDTPVCEEQTHVLGETKTINPKISRVTVSRDLPMAQKRFAASANLENIQYVSDYKTGSFGKSTGLMMKGSELLARGVIVTDQQGVIQYYQVVPDITQLPDMQKAIEVANKLATE